MKINKKFLPIKSHFFFFMAAMGPILPQINVFGKHLGISPKFMGFVTSILPILYILAKPAFGYLADYFPRFRKLIFMTLIFVMTLSYSGFYFVPESNEHLIKYQENYNFTQKLSDVKECNFTITDDNIFCTDVRKIKCNIACPNNLNNNNNNELFGNLILSDSNVNTSLTYCTNTPQFIYNNLTEICKFSCMDHNNNENETIDCVSGTKTFWIFVVLMCIGTIGFNVANSISDAICFDVLGEDEQMKYGKQRVWGSIGFGISALIAGIAVDLLTDGSDKSIGPALVVMIIFSGFDLLSVMNLKLPKLTTTDSIFKDVWSLLRRREISIFLIFATLVGVLDSFIIYFMFWHLEEVADLTGYKSSIKLIEGCVVAAECVGGEILFFLISGKIIKKIGYVRCLTLCFFNYFIRLILISIIPNPWWLVPIEFFMQGASYALCYTCIVAYASKIAPPGTSATVQGIFAGMDDGVGFALGSLIGGQMYQYFGGALSFRYFGYGALIMFFLHFFSSYLLGTYSEINMLTYEVPSEQKIIEREK